MQLLSNYTSLPFRENPVDLRRVGNQEISIHNAYCLCESTIRIGILFQFDEEPARSTERIFGISMMVDRVSVLFEGVGFQLAERNGFAKQRNLCNLVIVFGQPARFESIPLVHYDSE